MAVSAMVVAMASDRSLWLRTWAFAGARPKANADTSEMPAARYTMLDMRNLPVGSRLEARPRCNTRSLTRICIRISRSEPPTLSAGPVPLRRRATAAHTTPLVRICIRRRRVARDARADAESIAVAVGLVRIALLVRSGIIALLLLHSGIVGIRRGAWVGALGILVGR